MQIARKSSAPVTSLSALCLVLWASTCMCLIALFNRASTHIVRASCYAHIGLINFSSLLDSIACCLMLLAGRLSASEIFQLSTTAQPDATCHSFAPKPTHNALHRPFLFMLLLQKLLVCSDSCMQPLRALKAKPCDVAELALAATLPQALQTKS